MPIYEFYCRGCNTIYNFFSRRVNTEKIPTCPRCKDVPLKRKVSVFFTTSGKASAATDGLPDIDESRMEKAMAMLASQAEGLNESDPRQAALLLRKLSQAAGLPLGDGMEEALTRMERGDDIEQIEKDMGDILDGEDPFAPGSAAKKYRRESTPQIDETIYEL
ncbi:MAG: zinc ribbon domain-containing protein [Syntrophaceae bacterium]